MKIMSLIDKPLLSLLRGATLILLFTVPAFIAAAQPAKLARAQAMFDEGVDLIRAGTEESCRSAIPKLTEARRIFVEIKEPNGEANALFFLGVATANLGNKEEALQYFGQIEPLMLKYLDLLLQKTGDPQEQQARLKAVMYLGLMTHFNMAMSYRDLGNTEKALENFVDSLTMAREVEDKAQEARALRSIGDLRSNNGEKRKAIEQYKLALDLVIEIGDKQSQAELLNYIGKLYNDLQDNRNALEYFNKALPLRRDLKDRAGEGMTLANLGRVYSDLGENQKSLEFLLKALPIRREVKDTRGEALTLNNIGMVYFNLGDLQKALGNYNLAIPLFKEANDRNGEVTAYSNIGIVYNKMGDLKKALEYADRVLTLRRDLGDKTGEATALNNLGTLNVKAGDTAAALELFTKSLEIAKQIGDRKGEATAEVNLGTVYAGQGKVRDGINALNRGVSIFTSIGAKIDEAATLGQLTTIWTLVDGGQAMSIAYGKMAVNKYQALRKNIKGLDKELQQTYLKQVEDTYRGLADTLIRSGRLAEAIYVLNAFKDQQFFDFDGSPAKEIAQMPMTEREARFGSRYEILGVALQDSLQESTDLKTLASGRELTKAETERLQKLDQEILRGVLDLYAFLASGESDFASDVVKDERVANIADIRSFQTALRNLSVQTRRKTVAVYQLISNENFYALIVSPDGIRKVSTPVKSALLNDQAKELWGQLQSDKYDTTVLSKKIYDVVFKPLEASLPADTVTIMWSLDGNLRYLPMAALWDGKQFLAERYSHAVFTRADSERMTRAVSPVWTGTGFGSSKAATVDVLGDKVEFIALDGVKDELAAIFKGPKGGVIDGPVLPDGEFTRAKFIEALKTNRPLVHIASHFNFRPGDEARSFLLLGDGTAFALADMKRETDLFKGVELLSLSACNTAALQSDASGREIDGFAELAQRLGAGAVMATLWRVSDASTPWLMRDFYTNRQAKAGTSKADALRAAQIALIKGSAEVKSGTANSLPAGTSATRDVSTFLAARRAPLYDKTGKPPFAHPFYWAPFVLIGNLR
ncbi:hypothetical protein BH10ACI3_BH10ACI3_18710 [soil metagenome]